MSQKLEAKHAPVRAADLSPEWLAERRAIVLRDGHAIRAGATAMTIEIQCINQPDRWLALGIDGRPLIFTDWVERDAVLEQLWREPK